MERWVAKVLALIIIFVVVFVFTVLPIKVSAIFARYGARDQMFLSYMMCFGGGVFLCVYMMHMAPDARRIINAALVDPMNQNSYPVAELIIAAGLFLMIISESAVHRYQGMHHRQGHMTANKHRDAETMILNVDSNRDVIQKNATIEHLGALVNQEKTVQKVKTAGYFLTREGLVLPMSEIGPPSQTQQVTKSVNARSQDNGCVTVAKQQNDETPEKCRNPMVLSLSSDEKKDPDVIELLHEKEAHVQVTRSLMLLLALSLHHVFEGVSIGLKQSAASAFSLCLAIIAHEVVIAFSLGTELVKTYKSKRRIIIAAALCSAMVPLGILSEC